MSLVINPSPANTAMSYTDILNAVIENTSRPDQVSIHSRNIRQATLQLHSGNFWNKDVQLAQLDCVNPQTAQTLPLGTIDNYRRMKNLIILDSNLNEIPEYNILPADTETLLDENAQSRTNIWWQAGSAVNVRCQDPFRFINVYYYAAPKLGTTDVTFSSWIADLYPFAIIDLAVRMYKALTGEQETARMMDEITRLNMETLVTLDLQSNQ